GVFTPDRLTALELIAAQAAISMESALLLEREHEERVEAEAGGRRARVLSEATALMSSTLDDQRGFEALANLCVPSPADWAGLGLVEDGHTVRLAGAHRDPVNEPLLRELAQAYPARLGTTAPAASVLESGAPRYVPDLRDEEVRRYCVDDRHADL